MPPPVSRVSAIVLLVLAAVVPTARGYREMREGSFDDMATVETYGRLPSSGGPLKMMVYDFDSTISSEHVFQKIRAKFKKGNSPVSKAQLKQVSDGEWLSWFGGLDRLEALQNHTAKMSRTTALYIASFGFDIELRFAMKWAGIFDHFSGIVGADSCDADVKKGYRRWGYYKWKQILKWAKTHSPALTANDIGFADDSTRNLDETMQQCNTEPTSPICHLFVVTRGTLGKRKGITKEDMAAIEVQQRLVENNDNKLGEGCIDYDGKAVCADDVC